MAYADSAYAVFVQAGLNDMAVRAANNKALALINQNRYEEALKDLLNALTLTSQIAAERQRKSALQALYLNIGKCYIGLEQWSQAIDYTRKSLESHNNPRYRMIALNNFAAIYAETARWDSVLKYTELSYTIADSLNDQYSLLLIKVNQAEALLKLERYAAAIEIVEKNIRLSNALDYPYGLAAALNQKASYLLAQEYYSLALKALQEAEELALVVADKEILLDTWENLEEAHFGLENFKKAYSYQKHSHYLKDSLNSVANTKNFNELLMRFEASEKEKQIAKQSLEIKEQEATLAQRDLMILIISASLFLLLFLALAFFFRSRQMQERNLRKAVIVEKQKGLQSLIAATEAERKRISKDLHDGIGQKLTALRLGIFNLLPRFHDQGLHQELERIAHAFSESAEEVRQISHQMMPKALMEEGLVQALEDLIESGFKFSDIQCAFEYNRVTGRYSEQLEVSVYRIAQELLNNAMKHAQATEIQVQLTELNRRLFCQ